MFDCIIVGVGSAGRTAAYYLANGARKGKNIPSIKVTQAS